MSKTAGETLFLGVLIEVSWGRLACTLVNWVKNICPHQCEVTSFTLFKIQVRQNGRGKANSLSLALAEVSSPSTDAQAFGLQGVHQQSPSHSSSSGLWRQPLVFLALSACWQHILPYFTITTCANSHNKSPLKYLYCFIGSVVLENPV